MDRHISRVGTLIGFLLIMGSLFTAEAQGLELLHSEVAPVKFEGAQTTRLVLATEAGTVECESFTFSGESAVTTSSTFSLTPATSGCTAFFFLGATFDWNGCKFLFHLGLTSSADVVCPTGKEITITSLGCTVHIPPQTGLISIDVTNLGKGVLRKILKRWLLKQIRYRTGSECAGGPGEFTSGTWEGTVELSGRTSGGLQQGVWVT